MYGVIGILILICLLWPELLIDLVLPFTVGLLWFGFLFWSFNVIGTFLFGAW
jgi:hypothetical protein